MDFFFYDINYMTVARQLATTTVILENYTNDSKKNKSSIIQNTHTYKYKKQITLMSKCLGVHVGGAWCNAEVEKRWGSFMYFIVDKRVILLSILLIDGSPYKYSSDWTSK